MPVLSRSRRALPRAVAVARELAALPRGAYTGIKRQLRARALASNADVMATGADLLLDAWLRGDRARRHQCPSR